MCIRVIDGTGNGVRLVVGESLTLDDMTFVCDALRGAPCGRDITIDLGQTRNSFITATTAR